MPLLTYHQLKLGAAPSNQDAAAQILGVGTLSHLSKPMAAEIDAH